MELKFYMCEHCGNLITKVNDSGVTVVCCGQNMTKLVPNTTDAAQEKHVPVVSHQGDTTYVDVGSVAHPMSAEHSIEWVAMETSEGMQIHPLETDGQSKTSFRLLAGEKVDAVYAYCNLHGLWKI